MNYILYLLFFLILLIVFPIRISIINNNNKCLFIKIIFLKYLTIKIKKRLKEIDIGYSYRKYLINKEKEKHKFNKRLYLFTSVLDTFIIHDFVININTENEYIYFIFLMIDSYVRNNLLVNCKKVNNYKLIYNYSQNTSYLIETDFSFTVFNLIYVLLTKKNINRGVLNGKPSQRNNEAILR